MDGTKNAAEGFFPAPYHRKNKGVEHIPLAQRAEEAANYLWKTQWGSTPGNAARLPTSTVITTEELIKQADISK